ncbi:unnamed protein product [Pieris macdunnoughi]|uniref:Retroviral polymerase SH3-like domain-containing protein n=1 Tax=Pieris macdunnoughi TaxID=345717 RepID=A0A821UJ67_9NEOP|nr:unnamed protein product [Pieris macdunnoughi]
MLYAKNLPKKLWAEAVNTAAFVLNRTGKSKQNEKTPFEVWTNQSFDIHELKIFGTPVYAHIPKERRKKWDKKAEKGLMVGYGEDIKGYRIYFSEKNTVDTKRDVVFLEQEKNKKGEPIIMFDTKEENNGGEESQTTSEVTPTNFDEDSCEITMCESVSVSEYQPCSDEETSSEETTPVLNERSKRVRKQTSFYKCNNVYSEESEPVTYKDAMSRKDASKWSEAIDKELQTLKANNTWDYCDAPVNTKVVARRSLFW